MGYGVAPVEALVRRAADAGCAAIALTDVENLYGQVRFHHAARAAGIKAITGVELRRGFGPSSAGEAEGRLVLLARDRAVAPGAGAGTRTTRGSRASST
jgi:DNA polymerase III alpha subunit